jgi:transcription-repair coupling factor (superfamily II helicase)
VKEPEVTAAGPAESSTGTGTENEIVPVSPVLMGGELELFPELKRFIGAVKKARGSRPVSAGNLWGSSQALALSALVAHTKGPWVVVTSSDAEAESFLDDLATFGAEGVWFPAREEGRQSFETDLELVRQRLQLAQRLAGPAENRPQLIVTSLLSLLQPVPDAGDLERDFLTLQVNQPLDAEELLERLVLSGYVRQPLAEKAGEVSLRGEILDVYPFASTLPLRIELFDEEIESLRTFDPVDQRSVEKMSIAELSLAADVGGVEDGSGVPAFEALPHTTTFVEIEPLRVQDRAEGLRIRSGSHARALHDLQVFLKDRRRISLQSLPGDTVDFETRSVQAFSVGMKEAPTLLQEAALDTRVVVLCRTEAERHRFVELCAERDTKLGSAIDTAIGSVAKGFRLPALKLCVVNHRELLGVAGARQQSRHRRTQHRVRALQSFFDLKIGDVVVHGVHGVARFEGLVRMKRGEGEEEHLHLMFADDVSLYVPAARIDLVQRYIGTGSTSPPLDKIGSQSFRRRKEKVERALFDLATELLEVQARRALRKRPAWIPEGDEAELVRDLVGSFPHVETSDQLEVESEIVKDFRGTRSMDRLLCGDVGFGKTELALRAAFRVVFGGGQVALLVPTTLLAQQHYETFKERMADFPVEVAMLSRYVTSAKAKETVARIADGSVDIVIGTHRILSKDVTFKKLGLVVVDEEQRFGVTHKEHFKKLRATVDLLTLTATPIPRTLHMSLAGLRDISALSIPPEGRQEIETRLVDSNDDAFLREAMLLEHNRGGQVFFLHNRVQSIVGMAQRVSSLVPECSIGIGHGQMSARELERVMKSFLRGEIDVLVATTIIESGLDIPAAGTIIVDRADEFGLSELHQLRGRVGRGSYRARCLLLVDRLKPMRDVARERLKALEEMNQLGAGFAISMKDLEIRGAGNILGPQQSGHIAAIGYDMYCRLLKQVSERIQLGEQTDVDGAPHALEISDGGAELELGLAAFLPEDWITTAAVRLDVLRELAAVDHADCLRNAEASLRDRFGKLPEPALNLLRTFDIKLRAEALGIRRLTWRDGFYLVEYADRMSVEHWLAAAQGNGHKEIELRPLRTGVAHLVIPGRIRTAEKALDWLDELLKAGSEHPKMAT